MTNPTPLAPLLRDQRQIDAGHLKLLGIFHFVLAGFALIALGFLCLHWFFMRAVFSNPEMWKQQPNQAPPPKELFMLLKWFYVFMGACIVGAGVGNLLSGWCILKRRVRILSLVVAGFDCLCFPFGTVLGVFTFVVLLRDSVAEAYGPSVPPGAVPAPVSPG